MVQVVGDSSDLAFLARNFTSGRLRVLRAPRDEGFVVESDDFAQADSPESVTEKANNHLAVLSGVLRMERGAVRSLTSNAAIRLHSDGRQEAFLYVHDIVGVRAEVSVDVVRDGESVPIVQPKSRAVKIIELALSDAAVSKAYRLLGKDATSWVGLYRVYETIEKDVGGQHALQRLGWVSEDEIRRFKHSANSPSVAGDESRHGAEQHRPPSNPVTVEQGASIVHRLAAAWLDHKLPAQT